jgi:glycosyltransferase involved in cell wall biosynthesis
VGGDPFGDGEARLKAEAARLGLGQRARFLGIRHDVPDLLGASDLFVLPSLWEGASNVLLEALACDVPIVASRSAGNAQEVLGYGRFGLLVDPQDAAGMAQAILYQTSADAVRPGTRAADFPAAQAIARACRAVTDFAPPADARESVPAHLRRA